MSMPTLSNEPVNNQWLTEELFRYGAAVIASNHDSGNYHISDKIIDEYAKAILSKLESIEQEAYKLGLSHANK